MSFIDSMKKRYTTKVYEPSGTIDTSKIELLKEALRLTPSSLNTQPWKFTFVSDETIKKALADASYFNNEKVTDCHTLIVFSCIDNLTLFEQQIGEEFDEIQMGKYLQYSKPKPTQEIKDWLVKQVYISLGVCMSACAELEIDSTPMEGIETEKYDTILKEKDYKTLFAVCIGKRAIDDFNQLDKKPKSRRATNKVIREI